MGFFDKLFGGKNSKTDDVYSCGQTSASDFDTKYARMKECAEKVKAFHFFNTSCVPNAKEYTDAYEEFKQLSRNIKAAEFNKRLVKEAKEADGKSLYPYHKSFGVIVFDKKTDYLAEILQELQKENNRIKQFVEKKEAFDRRNSGIQECEIQLSDEKITRNSLIHMPEIKYANITKSFNKYKLTSFVVVDTETTGLKATSERIIQLSAVRYVGWDPVEFWNSYINPKREIPKEATEVNGITDEMVADKPTIKQVAKSFMEFVGNSDMVGYNLPFDIGFLYAEGIDLITEYTKRKYYDVLALARKVYKKDLESFALTDVAGYQGIVFDAHNSLNDCFATGELFCNLVDEITEV